MDSQSDHETMVSSSSVAENDASGSSAAASKRRKFACVECRQQKSKCDAYEKAPNPCTKCAKKGMTCVLKKDFRRTYKRAKHEAIEKRFKELTQALSSLSPQEIQKKLEEEQLTLLDDDNFTRQKIKQLKQEASNELRSRKGINKEEAKDRGKRQNKEFNNRMTPEQLSCSPKSLGDLYISSEDIASLFQEFATKYHPFLPIVDLTKGAERIYALSPCLFWVIIVIGLRRKPESHKFMTALSPLVKSILSEITISPIIRYTPSETDAPTLNVASVYSVQAFLLYTFWPPLTSSLSADTSWNTIGTAMFQAVRTGLNSAEFSKEYAASNSELVNENLRTWICCNVVSQMIASTFGFPAYVSFNHMVTSAITETLPRSDILFHDTIIEPIRQMSQIAYFENQIVNTMNSNPSDMLGMVGLKEKLPLLNVLSQQLGQLEIELEDHGIDDIRKFLLLITRVHLFSYYFMDIEPEFRPQDKNAGRASVQVGAELNFENRRGLVKAYNAAIDLLTHAEKMWKKDPTIIKYFPGVFVLNIWQTACIISKLVHSSLSALIDEQRGKKAYHSAVLLTFNASVLKHDMAYRSSGIMRSIWSMFRNMHEKWEREADKDDGQADQNFNLGVVIKGRMSVSVFFDCLYILKQKCGMAKLKREHKESMNLEEENDDDDYDEVEKENSVSCLSKGGNMKDISTSTLSDVKLREVKNPEVKARKIIETIPLDPNPISVSTNCTSTNASISPNSQHADVLSLKGILNRTSPTSEKNHLSSSSANTLSPILPRDPNEVQNRTIPEESNFGTGFNSLNPGSSESASPHIPQINRIERQASQTSSKGSPNSLMGQWDNWESDLVWKDVDLLMNEFAFNPSL